MSDPRRLYFWLQTASSALQQQARAALQPTGLTPPQLGVLFVAHQQPGCRLGDLARALHVNASAVTPMVGRLAKLGFLELRAAPTDRRAREAHLTEQGRRAVADAAPLLVRLDHQLSAGFTEAELDVVARFLHATATRARGGSHG